MVPPGGRGPAPYALSTIAGARLEELPVGNARRADPRGVAHRAFVPRAPQGREQKRALDEARQVCVLDAADGNDAAVAPRVVDNFRRPARPRADHADREERRARRAAVGCTRAEAVAREALDAPAATVT